MYEKRRPYDDICRRIWCLPPLKLPASQQKSAWGRGVATPPLPPPLPNFNQFSIVSGKNIPGPATPVKVTFYVTSRSFSFISDHTSFLGKRDKVSLFLHLQREGTIFLKTSFSILVPCIKNGLRSRNDMSGRLWNNSIRLDNTAVHRSLARDMSCKRCTIPYQKKKKGEGTVCIRYLQMHERLKTVKTI